MTCHHLADGGQKEGGKQEIAGSRLGVKTTLGHETHNMIRYTKPWNLKSYLKRSEQ